MDTVQFISKLEKYFREIEYPKNLDSNLVQSPVNSHFQLSYSGKLPQILNRVFKSGECFSSGYLIDVGFWVATSTDFYIVSEGNVVKTFPIAAPVVIAAIQKTSNNEYLVISHEKSISLFTWPSLFAVPNLYRIPSNVSVTCFCGKYVGCNDGKIREIEISSSEEDRLLTIVSVKGSKFGNIINPIVQITRVNEYLYALYLSSEVEEFLEDISKGNQLTSVRKHKYSNVYQMYPMKNSVISFKYNATLYDSSQNLKEIRVLGHNSMELFQVEKFTRSVWCKGFMAFTDPGPGSAFDKLVLTRTSVSPIASQIQSLGRIYSLSPTNDGQTLMILCSKGFVKLRMTFSDINNEASFDEFCWIIAGSLYKYIDCPLSDNSINLFIETIIADIPHVQEEKIKEISQIFTQLFIDVPVNRLGKYSLRYLLKNAKVDETKSNNNVTKANNKPLSHGEQIVKSETTKQSSSIDILKKLVECKATMNYSILDEILTQIMKAPHDNSIKFLPHYISNWMLECEPQTPVFQQLMGIRKALLKVLVPKPLYD